MNTKTASYRSAFPVRIVLLSLVALAIFGLLFYLYYFLIPISWDWHTFHDAALRVFSFQSPYVDPAYYNPPWIVILLLPLALLPVRVGSALVSALVPFAVGFAAWRLGAKPLAILAIAISPPVVFEMRCANITWLSVLGLAMPPQIGLFFVLSKPQVGIAAAVFWLVEAYRKGGVRQVVMTFAPFALVTLASFALYGFWPLNMTRAVAGDANISFWPWSIPLGLAMLAIGIKRRSLPLAALASPFLSPYLAFQTYIISFLGLSEHPRLAAAITGAMWAVYGAGFMFHW